MLLLLLLMLAAAQQSADALRTAEKGSPSACKGFTRASIALMCARVLFHPERAVELSPPLIHPVMPCILLLNLTLPRLLLSAHHLQQITTRTLLSSHRHFKRVSHTLTTITDSCLLGCDCDPCNQTSSSPMQMSAAPVNLFGGQEELSAVLIGVNVIKPRFSMSSSHSQVRPHSSWGSVPQGDVVAGTNMSFDGCIV